MDLIHFSGSSQGPHCDVAPEKSSPRAQWKLDAAAAPRFVARFIVPQGPGRTHKTRLCSYVSGVLQSRCMQMGGFQLKDGAYIFGFPDEWAKFQERFPDFLKAFDALAETMNKVRVRTFAPANHPVDETVFFLSSLVFEDFTEVWVMAGNGLGTGALKVLRGMYERAVTAAYISRFPDEAKQFWKFGHIAHHKVLHHAKELHGQPYLESVLGSDHCKEAEEEYQKVKPDFQKTRCKKCKTTGTMMSWSEYDLATMAKKAGYGIP